MQTYGNTSFKLNDQHCINLGLVGPEDRQRFLNGFKKISARTNINRFRSFKRRFTEEELHYLLYIDNIDHLAIGAVDCQQPDIGIGIARYIRSRQHPEIAEAAIIVIDEYQGKGLGKTLYSELMLLAQKNGIRYLRNLVGKDNRSMIGLLTKLGARKFAEDAHSFEYVIDLENNKNKGS